MKDSFQLEQKDEKTAAKRIQVLKSGLTFNPKKYVYNEDWVPAKGVLDVHSTGEMVEAMIKDPSIQLEARVLATKNGDRGFKKMDRKVFLEAVKTKPSKRLREAIDSFSTDGDFGSPQNIGGSDFTPLLGGPFNKQLYYRDYLRMISACYYASNHDPAAKAVTNILCDFTMGRGFQLHTTGKDAAVAQVVWNAFCKANDFYKQMDSFADELSRYGETMWWWLPNNQTRISFRPAPGEVVPKAMIPRIRLVDPSNFAEIITIPEDIAQGVLYYVWMAPTQYQMYTRDNQPTTKFIYQQIPAEQIMHVKVNSVSNEKRGRSDFFPSLGYMKRLRDGVNYGLVAQQKAAAWCIDTTIDGDLGDITDYITYQQQQERDTGEHTAGSEFVHTKAIEREYLANSASSKGSDSPVFQWCLSMIAMSSGIPISYLGTHLSGGSTRASALVATEPVAKRFERRQLTYSRTVEQIFYRVMEGFKIMNVGCDIIFPELIKQDRSALFKDLSLAQTNGWISKKRAAEVSNKELGTKDFNYEKEQEDIDAEGTVSPTTSAPLTADAEADQNPNKGSSLTATQKTSIKKDASTL